MNRTVVIIINVAIALIAVFIILYKVSTYLK